MSRHEALRATWQPGQVWETRLDELAHDESAWVPVADNGRAQPAWDERQDYRRVEVAAQINDGALTDTDRADLIAVADYLEFDGSMSEADAVRRAALLRRIAGAGGTDGR